MEYVWVTWRDNSSPRYDGKTHNVPTETIVDPPKELTVGTPVTIYWSHGKKKFWKGVIAPSKANQGKTIIKFNAIQCTSLVDYILNCIHTIAVQ